MFLATPGFGWLQNWGAHSTLLHSLPFRKQPLSSSVHSAAACPTEKVICFYGCVTYFPNRETFKLTFYRFCFFLFLYSTFAKTNKQTNIHTKKHRNGVGLVLLKQHRLHPLGFFPSQILAYSETFIIMITALFTFSIKLLPTK